MKNSVLVFVSACHIFFTYAYASNQGREQSALVDDFELVYGSGNFISIATGTMQPIEKAPAVATVITSDDIKKMGAKDIDDVLTTVPGLQVVHSNIGYNSMYVIRGIYSNDNPEVLLLINGIPMTNMMSGNRGYTWGGMPVEAIEHIEVIRGPGSAIHGADAYAGVINIITKKSVGKKGHDQIGVSGGSYNTSDIWLTTDFQIAGFNNTLIIEKSQTDGFNGYSEFITPIGAPVGADVAIGGEVNLQRDALDIRWNSTNNNWEFNLGYQDRINLGTGVGSGGVIDDSGSMSGDRLHGDIRYHHDGLIDNVDIEVIVSHLASTTGNYFHIYPAGVYYDVQPLIGNPYGEEYRTDLKASFDLSMFDKHSIRLGIGAYIAGLHNLRETKNTSFASYPPSPLPSGLTDVSDDPDEVFMKPQTRELFYAYLQDEWEIFPEWTVTAGARYDNYSDFGETVNPRAALVWQIDYELSAKLLYGSAFRAPSFQELHLDNNVVKIGNPSLKHEEIDTYEFAFNYRSMDTSFGINLYQFKARDRIRLVSLSNQAGEKEFQNSDSTHGHGGEIEYKNNINDDLQLKANLAYVEVQDPTVGETLPYISKTSLYASVDWAINSAVSLHASSQLVANRSREDGSAIPDNQLMNLVSRYHSIENAWEAALIIKNLLDHDQRDPIDIGGFGTVPDDIPLPGRTVFLELRYLL